MSSQLTWNDLAYLRLKHLLVDPKKLHPHVDSSNASKDDEANTSAAMTRHVEQSVQTDDTTTDGTTSAEAEDHARYPAEHPVDDEYVLEVDCSLPSQNLVRRRTLVNDDVALAMAVGDAQDVGAAEERNNPVDHTMGDPYEEEEPADDPPRSPTVSSDDEDPPVPPSSPRGRRVRNENTADLSGA